MTYWYWWKLIIVCLFLWLSLWKASGVQGITYQHLDSAERVYPGRELFATEERVYFIIWKLQGIPHSLLASTPSDQNVWTTFSIPGQAFFLDSNEGQGKILSIIRQKQTWQLTFYDLQGQQLHTLEHFYTKQPREYRREGPAPVTFPDGSLLFYGLYEYEQDPNPLNVFLREIFSGGHGKTPAWSNYIEVIPELVNSAPPLSAI